MMDTLGKPQLKQRKILDEVEITFQNQAKKVRQNSDRDKAQLFAQLKKTQHNTTKKAVGYSELDWNNFLFSFKEPQIRILEVVYVPKPKTVIYKHVYQAFKQINYSERTARRMIGELAKLGLLIHFRTTFGVIKPVLEITSNIQSLIGLFRSKNGRNNLVQAEYYDEIAKLILEDEEWHLMEEDQRKN